MRARSLGETLAEDFLGLVDGFHTLGLIQSDLHRRTENLAGLERHARQGQHGEAEPLRERNAVVLAERASRRLGGLGEGLEVLHLVAPLGESGDALLLAESLACGEESGERVVELFGIHGVVLFGVGVLGWT